MSDQQLLELGDLDSENDILGRMTEEEIRHHWPQQLTDYADGLISRYKRLGVTETVAKVFAYNSAQELALILGGHALYIPRGEKLERFFESREIWDEHCKGVGINVLAKKYDISTREVYNRIRQQKSLHTQKNQYQLKV